MPYEHPENPFVPGFGELPPVMGRRPEVEHELDDVMRRLGRAEKPGPRALYLYGPRGTGKTVHLLSLHKRLRDSRIPSVLLSLKSDRVATAADMRQNLFRPRLEVIGEAMATLGQEGMPAADAGARESAWEKFCSFLEKTPLAQSSIIHDIRAMTAHEGQIRFGLGTVTFTMPTSPDRSASESLVDLGHPMLITLDEAHMVEPAALRVLLNAVQEAGETRPVVLLLGGTPDLIDQLRVCGATFWDRGKRLPLGRLSKASATDVLAIPFSQAGITVDGPTLEELVKATDHYPWFLQIYGHEAYKAVQETGGRHLGPVIGSEALKRARILREMNYYDRRQEFRTPELSRAARAVAQAFRDHGGVMAALQLERMLAAFDTDVLGQTERHMRHVGLIVEGAKPDTIEPGVPSFMDYLLRVLEPDPPAPSPAEPEATDEASKDEFKP